MTTNNGPQQRYKHKIYTSQTYLQANPEPERVVGEKPV